MVVLVLFRGICWICSRWFQGDFFTDFTMGFITIKALPFIGEYFGGTFPRHLIWSNYSDLTRPHPKLWFSKGSRVPLFQGDLGWWNIIIWPDLTVQIQRKLSISLDNSYVYSFRSRSTLSSGQPFVHTIGTSRNFHIATPTKVSIVEVGSSFYYQFWGLFVTLFPIHCSIAPVK